MTKELEIITESGLNIEKNTCNTSRIADKERLERLNDFLREKVNEPTETSELSRLLKNYIPDLIWPDTDSTRDYRDLGSILEKDNRKWALELLTSGERRIVGTFVGGRVGGFIFNIRHKGSLEEVVRIKSLGGSERQNVFALVTTKDLTSKMVNPNIYNKIVNKGLIGNSFVQVPVDAAIAEAVPSQALSTDNNGNKIIQFFITPPGSPLDDLLREGWELDANLLLGGTSANFSGRPSLINRVHTSVFCLFNGVEYFDGPGIPNLTERGSFKIVRIDNDGNIDIIREEKISQRT